MPPRIRKTVTVRAVHANRGVEAKYRKQLVAMVAEMHTSGLYWLRAAYRKAPPAMVELAQDASVIEAKKRNVSEWHAATLPTSKVKREMKRLADRWIARFEEGAPKIAEAWARGIFNTSDRAFMAALKDAGWTVQFRMTPAVRDAFQASLAENVGLIKSIPHQYLTQVEGAVMRSYSAGRDLESLVKELTALYPAAAHRAELIARDQSNKANAVVNRARQLELGITRAKWMHSHAGKNPRPDHVAADGKEYDIAQGCLISGEYIQPGEEINCRCTSRAVLPI